ncbi:FG-GAP repeat protein [Nannocystis pusilla]|uniref:FG-GAP repeat protein n=1 Tax=Nannocystis pusilla TaxID=889268 RepID=A0ABS7TW54_9BACT|nr:FG-GAP repeat protein [Nannocystis pusilla]MBZ5712261.1 FG-GAP repeat protein [Nannocystis pusilla]
MANTETLKRRSAARRLGLALTCVGAPACFYNPQVGQVATDSAASETGTTATATSSTTDTSTGDTDETSPTTPTTTTTTTTSDTIDPPPGFPEATTLQLSFSAIKRFDFSWSAAAGATHYRLQERLPGSDDYVQLGEDIADESISLEMPLHLRIGASYVLQACNAEGCTDSEPVDVVDSMVEAVGYFKASNTDEGDSFGLSVALSAAGDTLAVGAYREASAATGVNGDEADDTLAIAGAVYVFARVDGSWSQQAYIKASSPGSGDHFGEVVALSADGRTLAVGARNEDSGAAGINGNEADNTAISAGAVYVFFRTGETWSQQAYVKASNAGEQDMFGTTVALSGDGDVLAVGAPNESSGATGIDGIQLDETAADAGAVYVFTRSNGTWSHQAYIKASNTGSGYNFGSALALAADGKTLAIASEKESSAAKGINGNQANTSAPNAGAVYVFVYANATWSQQAYVKASNTEQYDYFGQSVALSADGHTLAVGSLQENSCAAGIGGDQADGSCPAAGAVYVFTRTEGVWFQQAYVKASNPGMSDLFGYRVALTADGNMLAISASQEASKATGIDGDQADNSVFVAGAAYVFVRTDDVWSQRAYVKATNPAPYDYYGYGLALSADGSTLAVGANGEDGSAVGIGGDATDKTADGAGAVYLY